MVPYQERFEKSKINVFTCRLSMFLKNPKVCYGFYILLLLFLNSSITWRVITVYLRPFLSLSEPRSRFGHCDRPELKVA